MKKAAIYVRVSTDQQTIKNQVLILTEVARRPGWEIVQVFGKKREHAFLSATGQLTR
jgi:DNA invertase Pin-like site-specific DNA recombinase